MCTVWLFAAMIWRKLLWYRGDLLCCLDLKRHFENEKKPAVVASLQDY